MRNFPTDKYGPEVLKCELADLKKLNAEQWQVDLLKLNPEYNSWGPGEDYMGSPEGGKGWDSSQSYNSWSEFGPWHLDELNELVNFHFEIDRESHECPKCAGTGLNEETHAVYEDWYGKDMCYNIGKAEVKALFDANRLQFHGFKILPTPKEVNDLARKSPLLHDSINHWICVEAKAKDLGVYGKCSDCKGDTVIYDKPTAHVTLVLWFLHPRKGCSRGVEVKNITQENIPEVFNYLKAAAQRNADRFAAVVTA